MNLALTTKPSARTEFLTQHEHNTNQASAPVIFPPWHIQNQCPTIVAALKSFFLDTVFRSDIRSTDASHHPLITEKEVIRSELQFVHNQCGIINTPNSSKRFVNPFVDDDRTALATGVRCAKSFRFTIAKGVKYTLRVSNVSRSNQNAYIHGQHLYRGFIGVLAKFVRPTPSLRI